LHFNTFSEAATVFVNLNNRPMNKKDDLRKKIEAAIPVKIRGEICPHGMVDVFTSKRARQYVIDAVVRAMG